MCTSRSCSSWYLIPIKEFQGQHVWVQGSKNKSENALVSSEDFQDTVDTSENLSTTTRTRPRPHCNNLFNRLLSTPCYLKVLLSPSLVKNNLQNNSLNNDVPSFANIVLSVIFKVYYSKCNCPYFMIKLNCTDEKTPSLSEKKLDF